MQLSPTPVAPSPKIRPSDPLNQADCSLVSWHRPIPKRVVRRLEAWARQQQRYECTLQKPELPPSLFAEMPHTVRDWLSHDVCELARRLFDVSGAPEVMLNFGVIASDQCRKFHIDYLRYRLITSYLGPGTEWLRNADVNRDVLSDPPEDPDEANARIVSSPKAIQYAVAGDVLLMKGARHPDALPLVHRSPPVEHLGVRRVVLVLSVR